MHRALEIFWAFLRLGLIAFGGPIAHLVFFRRWFVEQRRWLSDTAYTQIVALAQVIPGPASSQAGFAIGLHRGGLVGGIAAWIGFTLPAAVIMIGFGTVYTQGFISGLKLAAIAVVAHALYGMAKSICVDWQRGAIAMVCAIGASVIPGIFGQISMLLLGAIAALMLLKPTATPHQAINIPVSRTLAVSAFLLFIIGFLLTLGLPGIHGGLWSVLFQSGALVFGGGHVVLPLLESGLVPTGLIDTEAFLAGYGAAQAIPGPLFTFAGYLGAQIHPELAILAGGLALICIFAPGLLLVLALLPVWQRLTDFPRAQQALTGINIAVVGLLAAVLINPLLLQGINDWKDAAVALLAFAALLSGRVPVYLVVIICAAI
ncbi:chromate efflux transporter [Spiribacter salilacus]|uniref:chromate efflux transporter n=1 Tax=Spiribacter salilacus TaxID=2664894 RepID=UPI00350E51B2